MVPPAIVADAATIKDIATALTALAVLIGSYVGYQTFQEKRKTDKTTASISLLEIGQRSQKEALERADVENSRLRKDLSQLQEEYDTDRIEWKQDRDEWNKDREQWQQTFTTLKTEVAGCTSKCTELQKQLEELRKQ